MDATLAEFIKQVLEENTHAFAIDIETVAVSEGDMDARFVELLTQFLEENAQLRQENRRLKLEIRQSRQPRDVAAQLDTLLTLRTGVAGRPTSIHLVHAEHKARMNRGDAETSVRAEAEFLADWLRVKNPQYPPLTRKTIENNIWHDHNDWKANSQK